MRTTWWVRSGTFAVTGLVALLVGGRAWADTNVALRGGQVPTTAAAHATHSCDGDSGGGPYADQDVWSFRLPDSSRGFVSVTASFDTNGDSVADTTLSAPQAGGVGAGNGTGAWIVAPALATLLTASAVATGTAAPSPNFFIVDRTCPAGVPASPSPRPSASPSAAAVLASTKPRARVAQAGESRTPSTSASLGTEDAAVPSQTPSEGIGTGSQSTGVQAADGDSGIGADGLVLGVGALLGSVACAGGLIMIRQQRGTLGRRRGRHHRRAFSWRRATHAAP